MSVIKWKNKKEEEYLIENYAKQDVHTLSKNLEKLFDTIRDKTAIYSKARTLGLSKKNYTYSPMIPNFTIKNIQTIRFNIGNRVEFHRDKYFADSTETKKVKAKGIVIQETKHNVFIEYYVNGTRLVSCISKVDLAIGSAYINVMRRAAV